MAELESPATSQTGRKAFEVRQIQLTTFIAKKYPCFPHQTLRVYERPQWQGVLNLDV